MTNTGGSRDKGVSKSPQSPTPAPPPTSQNPTTPASGIQVNPTAIPTRPGGSAGGSSASVVVNVAVATPRKRGSTLVAGEGSSRRGMGAANQTRSVRPNVPLLIATPPAAPANPPPPPPQPENTCVVCHKDFHSVKALFGHMNSHPNRGWKGVYPPPTFNREEFADLQAQMQQEEEEEEVAGNAGDPAVEEAPSERRDVVPDLNVAEPAVGEGYRLPDLNLPPPAEE